jgi:hypothetical protein
VLIPLRLGFHGCGTLLRYGVPLFLSGARASGSAHHLLAPRSGGTPKALQLLSPELRTPIRWIDLLLTPRNYPLRPATPHGSISGVVPIMRAAT